MKILLVMHECNSPYSVFPYGIGYLGAVLRNAGHSVTIFDQATGHYSDNELYSYIQSEGPFDFIGLGFQAAYFPIVKTACEAIKKACGNTPLVLGGSAPSASPGYLLKKLDADYVMIGECENSVLGLVEHLAGNMEPENVPGLCWKQKGEFRQTLKDSAPADLDAIPFPAWDLFDMKSYTAHRRVPGVNGLARVLGMLTTRGCPYTCKFCFRLEPGYRIRSIENCIDELKILVERFGVNHIGFHDDLFMVNKKRTLEFCEAIHRNGLRFTWGCNGRFNIADREQLRAMREAGCTQISYGLESGDQKVLDEMDKRITVEQILEISAITKEEGILVSVPSMFGLPGETGDSLRKTVDAIIAATSWHDKRTIRPMQPYPGSYYFDYCVERGLLNDEGDFYARYFSSENLVANLTELSDSEFNQALYDANERLLAEHYEHAYEADIAMFNKIYFEGDPSAFIPMR